IKGVPFGRQLLSIGASFIFQVVFPTRGIRDYTSGYRAYSAKVLKKGFATYQERFIDQQGFQCMVDILLKLRKLGATFSEVPISWRYDMKRGVSKMKVLLTVRRTLSLVFRRRLGL